MEYHSCPSQGSKINTSSAARAHCRPLVVGTKSSSKVVVGVGGVWRTELEPRPGRLWNPEGRTTKSPTHSTSNSYRYSCQALNTFGPQRRAQCLQSPETNHLTSIPSERSNQCEEVLRKALSSKGLPHLWGHRTLSLPCYSPNNRHLRSHQNARYYSPPCSTRPRRRTIPTK